jgi:hypothetical protein
MQVRRAGLYHRRSSATLGLGRKGVIDFLVAALSVVWFNDSGFDNNHQSSV